MERQSFSEVKADITANIKKGRKGNPIKSFSRNDFNKMINAMINDVDYQMESVKLVKGKPVNQLTPTVKDLRENLIIPVLVRAGVKKDKAREIAESFKYNSGQTNCIYNFLADAIYQYIDSGKKFNFPNRKDFSGSIYIKEFDEKTVDRVIRDRSDHSTVIGNKTEKREKYKTIVKKSTCPSWLRHVI